MKQRSKKILCLVLTFALMMGMSFTATTQAKTAKKPKLNKTKLSLQVNKSATLKVKNTKKKVKWSSSKKSVATVSQKGKVKAKKAGKATITAKVGKKKLKCKVTVAKPKKKAVSGSTSNAGTNAGSNTGSNTGNSTNTNNVVKEPDTKITSLSVVNCAAILVTLNQAQSLTADNFTLKVKYTQFENYNRDLSIESISTNNQITYLVELNKDNTLVENETVQLTLSGLKGTGVDSAEATYLNDTKHAINAVYSGTVGQEFYQEMRAGVSGYAKLISADLPAGLNCKISGRKVLTITGKPTTPGKFNKKIVYCDERGINYTMDVLWIIGDKNTLLAACCPVYGTKKKDTDFTASSSIYVTGGSGEYHCKVSDESTSATVNDANLQLSGTFTEAGRHMVSVEVEDANNPDLKTSFDWVVDLAKGNDVKIVLTDKNGLPVEPTEISVLFTNQDKENLYCTCAKYYNWEKDDIYVTVPNGVYDIYIYFDGMYKTEAGCSVSEETSSVTIPLPCYCVFLTSDDEKLNLENAQWLDEANDTVGNGSTLYLKPGKYTLHGLVYPDNFTYYDLEASFTVSSSGSNTVSISGKKDDLLKGPINLDSPITTHLRKQIFHYYTFCPSETGTYKFYTTGGAYTIGILRDINQEILVHKYYGSNHDFTITYTCEAGQTYYIGAALVDSLEEQMDVTIKVEKSDAAN